MPTIIKYIKWENNSEDKVVLSHIENLTGKVDKLYLRGDMSDIEVRELHELETELDRYWDLLRQRRALREAGKDPDKAELRSGDTVERY